MKVIVSCSGKFHAFNLVEELQRNGIEVLFFTSYSSNKNSFFKYFTKRRDNEVIDFKNIKTNIFIAFGLKIFRKHPQFVNNYFDIWVSKKIQKLEADWFIGWSSMSEKSIKVAKSKGIKTVLERGSTHILFQQNILQYEYKIRGRYFQIDQKTISKEILEYSIVDLIAVPSRFVKKTFLDNGVDANKIFVNQFGASKYFFFDKSNTNFNFRVLYLGTFSIRKGAYYLYEAIKNIKQLNIEFWFIGKVDQEVIFLSNELKNMDNVTFFGHINHYDLNSLINQCSVAIHPSIEEGQSMVINQVMQCGVPFIATPNSGAEELIIDEFNGIIIPAMSSSLISAAIVNLYSKPLLLRRLSSNIMQTTIKENTWESYAKRYINILKYE
jgi:glycosyltransferase involved in cell wall biosynthesis